MKKIILIALLLLFPANAQAADLKIGVFTLAEVMANCNAYREKAQEIEQRFESEQNTLKMLELEIKDRYAQYINSSATLNPSSKSALSAELVNASREFEAKKNKLQGSLYDAEEQANTEVQAIIDLAAEVIGKREGFALIVDSETLHCYYMSPALDITSAMIKEVNKIWTEKPNGIK